MTMKQRNGGRKRTRPSRTKRKWPGKRRWKVHLMKMVPNRAKDAFVVKNLQDVMHGISTVDDGMDKRLPVKKQGGPSKSSTKRSTDQVYLTKSNTATTQKRKFMDTFIHPHSRVILKLTTTLKMTKVFREFN